MANLCKFQAHRLEGEFRMTMGEKRTLIVWRKSIDDGRVAPKRLVVFR